MDGVFEVAGVVDVEADFFGAEGLAGGSEEAVHDLLGLQTTRCGAGVKRAGELQFGIGGALISVAVQNEAGEVFHIVTAAHELAPKPFDQFEMGRLAFFPVFDGLDDAAAHEAGPDAVGGDLSEALVLRRGDHGGEHITRVLWIFGELAGGFIAELGEGPLRLHFGAGDERDLDQGLASTGVDLVHRHAAGLGHFDFLRAEHGGEFEEILLQGFAGGRVVAARALHFHAEEGGADDGSLRRHGHVVL